MKNINNYTEEEMEFYLYQQTKIKNHPSVIEKRINNAERKRLKIELRDKERARKNDRAKYLKETNPKYRRYIDGANKRNIVFGLSVEQFNKVIDNTKCVYCGTPDNIGIDRVDSSYGYIVGNVQPCCFTCNIMKRKLTHAEFLKVIHSIYKHSIEKC